jgi:hypothetical protein
VAGAALDHAGAGGQRDLLAVVELEVVGGVHAGGVGLEDVQEAGQLLGGLRGQGVGVAEILRRGGLGRPAQEQDARATGT